MEKTLGKLAKWLRLLGFDAVYESDLPQIEWAALKREQHRILLTRTEAVKREHPPEALIFMGSDQPFQQLAQVVQALGIERDQIDPFTRCLRCNQPITEVERSAVKGAVPDYVWETHERFRTCSQCRRIYWSGTHNQRSTDIIDRLFSSKPQNTKHEIPTH